MSTEKSSSRLVAPSCADREFVSFSDPAIFWVDESGLQEYLQMELARLNKSKKRA